MIEKEFGVHYNTTYIWQLLRVLGYSAQILIAVAMEMDEEYVKKWLSEDYPQYVKGTREHEATILFLDESGMQNLCQMTSKNREISFVLNAWSIVD